MESCFQLSLATKGTGPILFLDLLLKESVFIQVGHIVMGPKLYMILFSKMMK